MPKPPNSSTRSVSPRALCRRLTQKPWTLTGAGLALLVVLVLPSAQIKLGAAQLQGLIGSYTGSGWQALPCDTSGNLLPNLTYDNDGFLPLTGTQTGTASNDYPQPMRDAAKSSPNSYGWYLNAFSPSDETQFPYTPAPVPATVYSGFSYNGIGLPNSYDSSSHADNYAGSGNSLIGDYSIPNDSGGADKGDIKGSVTTHLTGALKAHFKWFYLSAGQPAPPPAEDTGPPDQMYLLLHTRVTAGASVSYGTSGLTSGLTTTATATDGMGDTLTPPSPTATVAQPYASVSQTLDSPFMLTPTLDGNGVAEVLLNGSTSTYAGNTISYGAFNTTPPYVGYYMTTNGATSATARAAVAGRTQAVAPLQAHSTVDSAGWDARKPRFFSGTNCRATGILTLPSPLTVSHAQLSIGGTVVEEYDDTAKTPLSTDATIIHLTGTSQGSVTLPITFDSTHFSDGTSLQITFQVWDNNGKKLAPANVSAPVSNGLLAMANQTSSAIDPNTGENVAENAVDATGSHYQTIPGVKTQSAPNNFFAAAEYTDHKNDLTTHISLVDATVFFAATHTDPGYIGDCYSVSNTLADGSPNPAYDPGAYLSDADIKSAITARKPSQAPYLFVFIHGCDAGGNTGLASDFDIHDPSSDDRAFVGYGAAIAVTQQNTNYAVKMWQYLMQGLTVGKATEQAASDFPIQAYPTTSHSTTGPAVYGDPNMTLHGKVYQWVSGPTWYR